MEILLKLPIAILLLIALASIAIFVYVIAKRVDDKANEDFEERKN